MGRNTALTIPVLSHYDCPNTQKVGGGSDGRWGSNNGSGEGEEVSGHYITGGGGGGRATIWFHNLVTATEVSPAHHHAPPRLLIPFIAVSLLK